MDEKHLMAYAQFMAMHGQNAEDACRTHTQCPGPGCSAQAHRGSEGESTFFLAQGK